MGIASGAATRVQLVATLGQPGRLRTKIVQLLQTFELPEQIVGHIGIWWIIAKWVDYASSYARINAPLLGAF